MARRIHLASYQSTAELERRYRRAKDPVARSRWQMLWLLSSGHTATAIAGMTGYSAYWIGQMARRYNEQGPDGVEDQRHRWPGRPRLLSAEQQADLRQALHGAAPDGEVWTGRTVAEWLSTKLGRPVSYGLGWAYLRRLGLRPLAPRPRHVKADAAAQQAFKRGFATPFAR
jgi:transposase